MTNQPWAALSDAELAALLLRMTGTSAPRTSAAYRRELAREAARRLRAAARAAEGDTRA